MNDEQPKKKRGRPRKDASGAAPASPAKKRGRPPGKPAGGGLEGLLAQLRAEREKLMDRVTAIGTAIDALEAA